MKKGLLIIMLFLLLSGCAAQPLGGYETVDDVLPTCALADAPYRIGLTLPDEAQTVTSNDSGTVYEAPDGAYTICTCVMVSDSLDAAVYALSGFAQPQLRVDLEDTEECQFAWCSVGEQGEMVCRAKVRRVGDYCYCLCFRLREGLGREYNGCINEVFSSFSLASIDA